MSISRHPQHAKAITMLLLANFFWGISFPTIKALGLLQEQLVKGGGNWFVTSMTVAPRFVLASLILLVLLCRRLRDTTALEIRQGLMLSCFAGMGMLFQNDGLQFTAASTSAFLTQFYAIMIPLWLALRGRRSPGSRIWLCCGLVLVGVAILGHFDLQRLSFGRGELETLLSSVFFMGQILTLDEPRFSGNRPERITLVMVVTLALIFSALALVTTPSAAALMIPWTSVPWVGLTLVLTCFCTVGAFALMNTWQPKITSTEAGLIYCVEPIFGSLMALCVPALYSLWADINYPNESTTWHLLVGGLLITLANVLLQMKPPSKVPGENRLSENLN